MKIASLAAALVLVAAPPTSAVTNPHVDSTDNSSCLFCHVQGFETALEGEYTLVEERIDAVCLRCHTKTQCCAVGQKHMDDLFIGNSHPSDLEASDMRRESRPKSLPLQDGRMTCNTCHLHRRPAVRSYKLVRLVEFTDTGVDWAPLCLDCHAEVTGGP